MQLNCSPSAKQSGNTLFLTLILAILLGTALGSYLHWVCTQNLMVAESQAWNSALALAEAGIEDGMAQVNVTFGTNYMPSLLANSWGGPASDLSYGPRTSGTNLVTGSYSVIIQASNPYPVITATGYTTVPLVGKSIARTVQVTTTFNQIFGNAIAALVNVTMNGNNITVDSYDSSDPTKSTGGLYDPAKRQANGDVSSTSGIINVGNANIYGHLRTAPWVSAGYSIGPQGRVGDLNWAGPGLEPGYWSNDYNANFPDVTPPYSSGLSVPTIKNGTNTLATGNYYYSGNYTINNNETLHVTGNASLYITGTFNMKSQTGSLIQIDPGATLTIYVGGASATFTQVNNQGNAATFRYYGLPANTSVAWTGNAAYMGTVYAPEAAFSLGGGGNSTTNDFQGSCVVQSVTMNGHFNLHYDENLHRNGPVSGFAVSSWRELAPPPQ